MEASSIYDGSSSRSTGYENMPEGELSAVGQQLLAYIRMIACPVDCEPVKSLCTLIEAYANFADAYEEVIKHGVKLTESEYKVVLLLGLGMLRTQTPANYVNSLYELLSVCYEKMVRDSSLTNFTLDFLLCLCIGKYAMTNYQIIRQCMDDNQKDLTEEVTAMSSNRVQYNAVIRSLVLSKVYEKISYVSSFYNIYPLLLLTSVVVKIDILSDDVVYSLLDRLIEILYQMSRRMTNEEIRLLLKIMTKDKWKDEWVTGYELPASRLKIYFRLYKVVNLVTKKLLKDKYLENRNRILKIVLRCFNPSTFQSNDSLLYAFMTGVRREQDPEIEATLSSLVSYAVKGEVTLKIVKCLIRNMKISSSHKNSCEVDRILKNFKLLDTIQSTNNLNHKVIEMSGRSAIIYFYGINIKKPYTIILGFKTKLKINELCNVITLVNKKNSVSILIKKKFDKKDCYELRVSNNNLTVEEIYEFEAPCYEVYLSISAHEHQLVITVNNFCFLVKVCFDDIKNITLGSNIGSNKLNNRCAIKELFLFSVLGEFIESSQLFSRLRERDLTAAKFKQNSYNLKMSLNLGSKAEWENKISTGGILGKFFHGNEEIAQEKECYRVTRQNLLRMLYTSGNLDVFLMLIEYYSLKTKDSEFIVLVDCILSFLIRLLKDEYDKPVIKQWFYRSINKFGLIIWIISYTTFNVRDRNDVISKILEIIQEIYTIKVTNQEIPMLEIMKNTYLNFQLWRNFSYEDQLALLSIVNKQLFSDQTLGISCIERDELKRLLIPTISYYKLDISSDPAIKRKLTKEQLLRLQAKCRDIFVRTMHGCFIPMMQSKIRANCQNWSKNLKNVFYLCVVTGYSDIEMNSYYSRQSFFYLLKTLKKVIYGLNGNYNISLFQYLLNKYEFFKKMYSLLFVMLYNQIINGMSKYKKVMLYSIDQQQEKAIELEETVIVYQLQDIIIEIMVARYYNIESIIDLFDKIRRRDNYAFEVTYFFKLLALIQKRNLPGYDILYRTMTEKMKDKVNNSRYFVVLRDELFKFIQQIPEKNLIEMLNLTVELVYGVMKCYNEPKELTKLILKRYVECERMDNIPQSYWVHINLLKYFPILKQYVSFLNFYRLEGPMMRETLLKFIQTNAHILKNCKKYINCCLMSYIFLRAPVLGERYLSRLIETYNILGFYKSNFNDLVLLKMLRMLYDTIQLASNHKQPNNEQIYLMANIIPRVFTEEVLRTLQKEAMAEVNLKERVAKDSFASNLEGFYKILTGESPLTSKMYEIMEELDMITKLISTLERYAYRPTIELITFPTNKLTINKYVFRQQNRRDTNNIVKSFDVGKARDAFNTFKAESFDMVSDFFEDFYEKCLDIERYWKQQKQLNHYWQYLTVNKENFFFGVYNTYDTRNSRVSIKYIVHTNYQQFPRRKSANSRFRLSADNNSSLSKSEEGTADKMMQSMIFYSKVSKKKSAAVRRESVDIIIEKEEQGIYYCEYIKPKGVYFGKFRITDGKAVFYSNPNEEKAVNKDTEMKLSTNEAVKLNEEKKVYMILSQCRIFTRRYIMRHTAIEVFTKGSSYLFNFFKQSQRDEIMKSLKKKGAICVAHRRAEFEKERFTEKWKFGKISNFYYLMKINYYSGRTYNDLSQYPIFPWILKNYKAYYVDQAYLADSNNFRDLTLPIGMLNKDRFYEFTTRYNEMKNNPDEPEKFLYGSFYSNPTIISNFLIRLEPFTTLHWKHQSRRFDHADRLFSSVYDQFTSAMKNTSDLRELIPYFYSWAEFLRNRNQFNFGLKQNKTEVNDVECPKWASCPEYVIFRFRYALYSEYVSKNLNKWIDLIFGYKAKKNNALAHNNLFHTACYEHDIFETTDEDEIMLAQTYVSYFGQVPYCLFDHYHISRQVSDVLTIDTVYNIDECKEGQFLIISNDRILVPARKSIYILQINILQVDDKYSKKSTVLTETTKKRFQFLNSKDLKWLYFGKEDAILCIGSGMKARYPIYYGHNMMQSRIIDGYGVVTAEYSRVMFLNFKENRLKLYQTSHCHQDTIYIIEYCQTTDILVTIDKDNILGMHYAKHRHKIREFSLYLKFHERILSIRIHPLGFIILWTTLDKILIYNFCGDKFLDMHPKLPAIDEEVTQMRIFANDRSLILLSSNKGFIYSIDIFDMYRLYKSTHHRTYNIYGLGILGAIFNSDVKSKIPKKYSFAVKYKILDFEVDWSHRPFWKVVVLYYSGKVCYYLNKKEKEHRIHEQIYYLHFT